VRGDPDKYQGQEWPIGCGFTGRYEAAGNLFIVFLNQILTLVIYLME
jgi:hypothetical protein